MQQLHPDCSDRKQQAIYTVHNTFSLWKKIIAAHNEKQPKTTKKTTTETTGQTSCIEFALI